MLRLSRSYYLGSGFGVAAVQQAGAAAHSGSGGNAYGASGGSLTEFVRRASNLKRRFRGKSQYEFARGEAQRFLDAEVPKTNVNAWMETGNNAVALSQILGFFEVQPDATLSSLLLNKLVRTAEDSSVDSMTRLHAMAALIAIRPEENYERAFTTVESVLRGGLPTDPMMRWNTLDECARALLRCGRRIPTHLSDQLTSEVMTLMRQTDQSQFPMYQSSLLRVYNWMVRVGREEARSLLYTLVLHTGEFQSYRFSTLMLSCVRHHYSHPLPVELIQKLARTGLQYCVNANGHGAAATVGGVAKMLMTLEPGVNGVTAHDISELNNRFNALLEDYKPRVERFMTVGDKLYWNRSDDITSIAFAYELGGRMRYRSVFTAFSGYVQSEVSRFEPTQLAMATGILRRSHLLSADIADKLSSRVEVVLGELRLAELGHVCATFASLPAPPAWMEEAKAVALRHNYAEAVGLTRLNLAVAFPHVDAFTTSIDYTQLTGRQLVDALPMVLGKAQFEGPVVSALVARLSGSATAASPVGATAASPVGATADRFSPDDMSILLQSGRPQLVHAANAYLYRRFSEAEWDADTLFSLPLVLGKGGPAQDAVKALAAAKTASISPEQFVSLVELLVRVFSDTDASINTFVVTGGQDLLEAELVLARTIVRYLSAVRASVKLHPGEPWLSSLLEKKHFNLSLLSVEEVENLLLSLHAIYGDVSRTPAMQMILSDIVEHCFQPLTEPTEQAARLTVLLVHLQQGLSLPLLSSQTPLVAQVQQSAATYAKDVRDAVLAMPLPTPVPAEKKMGRFTLKHIKAVTAAEEGDNSAPLLDLTLDDPFAYSPITASSAASPDARVAVAAAASVQPSPPPPLAEPVVEAAAVAASSLPPAAATMPQQEPVMHTDHHHHHPVSPPQADKPTSYYAKFFSFMRGDEERESHRPRRTNLPVNNHNAAGATPHATEAEFPGWGAPPTFGAPPTAASTAVDMNSGWGAPTGQDAAAPTQQYGMPTTAQNAALFSNIFDQQQQQHAHPTDASYPPASNPEAAASASPTHTAFNSMFTDSNLANSQQAEPVVRVPAGSTDPAARAPTLRNNMVFFDPAAPRGAGAAGAGRPMMMSKKAVMSRMNPNRPPSADDGSAMPAAEARPRHLANKLDFSRPPPSEYTAPPVAAPEVVAAASAATPDSTLAPSSSSSPLAWQEAARRVAGISRYTKTKAKTRNQRSLTEWLKNPDKKLDAEPTTTATTSATSATAAQSGRGKKKDKAAVAEAPAAPAKHAKHAKGGGRGGADSSAKGKKGAKAASAKKAPAKASKAAKPAAASRAKKPAAKKAAASKAKPKPKPAGKKAPAASKKAPAKKPAPKKAAKGKKK